MARSSELGELPIPQLLWKQSAPASAGFLVFSIYSIVDTIFVGQFVGSLAIGAISVVMPISFFISAVGLAIGIGGASVISRALGKKNPYKAYRTFGNQITLTLIAVVSLMIFGLLLDEEILYLFGGRGDILQPALIYYRILLLGTPFLGWAMMANNVIRAQGRAKTAMFTMIIPAILNIILDPIFIVVLKMGIAGAAWATFISYVISAMFTMFFFRSKRNEIRMSWAYLSLKAKLVKEIFAIGGVSFARQGSVTLLLAILNVRLFQYGGETGVAVYGIINRLMMFSLFPVMGLVQGSMPIVGYNFGAHNRERVLEVVKTAIKYGTGMGFVIILIIIVFSKNLVMVFTHDRDLIEQAPSAMIWVFLSTPLIASQLLGSAYFQAVGKAWPALWLTMTKQGFILVPLVLIMPKFLGMQGIWYSFPIADLLATAITISYLLVGLQKLSKLQPEVASIKAEG